MSDLIGLTEASHILNLTRSGARWLYLQGELQAIAHVGAGQRKRPLFLTQHVVEVARKRAERRQAEVARI